MTDFADNSFRIAVVGFGEAGQAFVSGWALEDPRRVSAFDIKTNDAATRGEIEERYRSHGIGGKATLKEALAGVGAVFSVVTADQAFEAAKAGAEFLPEGAFWFDCNSCAPNTKKRAAEVIDAAGGRYVDVAVMAPVHPKKHLVPLLIGGPHAAQAEPVLKSLGMKPEISGEAVGDASSVKMLRSVMIKGFEALCAECFVAARKAGVEEKVLASLEASDPDINWRKRGAYNLERMMVHGIRRAAEVEEVVVTIKDLGLPSAMSQATVQWQRAIGTKGIEPGDDDLFGRADLVISNL